MDWDNLRIFLGIATGIHCRCGQYLASVVLLEPRRRAAAVNHGLAVEALTQSAGTGAFHAQNQG